jgi:8-oxo-dGTP diphosphatase
VSLHYWLGRVRSPLSLLSFYIGNFLFQIQRARVVVLTEEDELLLVRNWTGRSDWGLPGGGMERNERPVDAAQRELKEETGIDLPIDAFSYIATFHAAYEAPIFLVTIQKDLLPQVPYNPREITALQWFPVTALPKNCSPLVALALNGLSKVQ